MVTLGRDTHESRHSNFPSATSRICNKLKKVCVDSSAGNRVFGPYNQLCHSRTFFKQNKNSESSFRMSEIVKQSTNITSGVDKVGLLTSTIQAVLPARLNCDFLQMQQISSLLENLSYLDKIVLNENSKIELKWWVQNLELRNSRTLIQPLAAVLIQTDASTTQQRAEGKRAIESQQVDAVCSGNEKPHKCLRTFSHKTGYTNVLEKPFISKWKTW